MARRRRQSETFYQPRLLQGRTLRSQYQPACESQSALPH